MLSPHLFKTKTSMPSLPVRAGTCSRCRRLFHKAADCQKTKWPQTDKIFSFICNELRCEVHSSPFLSGVASFKRLKTEHPLIDCQVRRSYQDVGTISQGCPARFKFVETLFFFSFILLLLELLHLPKSII